MQAEAFSREAGVTGIVLTKLDGTAKGGVAVAVADRLGVPIQFVGVGEELADLAPFDPDGVRGVAPRRADARWSARCRPAGAGSSMCSRFAPAASGCRRACRNPVRGHRNS